MSTLYDKLKTYRDSDYYGFHMPGHKRNLDMSGGAAVYGIDITEIEGFDDLHHAEGILKDAQRRAARVWHAGETHFLVNGSTVGILSAIAGVTDKGDSILVARNCHKSVYHAIYMNELVPVYLYPGFDEELQLNTEISVQDVRRALKRYPQIRAVVIVSPTYDGVVSDVAAIAEAAHEMGVPLIVDEAHGAHFGFHPYFPENSNRKGADIVIHSVHKTLPALTQTALLHMNGGLVDRERVRRYLHMLQSSSPSYVLMASIEACVDLLECKGEEMFSSYVKLLEKTRKCLAELKHIRLAEPISGDGGGYDRSKIVLSAAGTDMTGQELYAELLDRYHLQLEMRAGTYVLAMTSAGDTEDGMRRLVEAVREIDAEIPGALLPGGSDAENLSAGGRLPAAEMVYTCARVMRMRDDAIAKKRVDNGGEEAVRYVPWEESEGYISTEYAYLYPPGIPLLVPGERITREVTERLLWYRNRGFSVEGLMKEGHIEVWLHG